MKGLDKVACVIFLCIASGFAQTIREAPATTVDLEFIGTKRDRNGSFLYEFRLTNGSAAAISYEGYSASAPLYRAAKQENGVWEEVRLGWCGVGVEKQWLKPNESVLFAVPEREDRIWRVGILVSSKQGAKRIWSEAVSLNSKKEIVSKKPDAPVKTAALK